MKALKFIGDLPLQKSEPVRSELDIRTIEAFTKPGSTDPPTLYVIRVGDLDPLRQLENLTVYRNKKNKAKQLSQIMLGYAPRVPLLVGSYSVSGSMKKSIWTFLKHALQKERNLYVIGVDETIFNELWEQAGDAFRHQVQDNNRPAGDDSGKDPSKVQDDVSPEDLLKLLYKIEVPKEFEGKYIGTSQKIELVRKLVIRAAQTSVPVLILGDSGTGKEIIARAIHDYGPRAEGPFLAINCASIPSELLESELFGHKKGAFTGAHTDKTGLWKLADKGTLFLDEIGDLDIRHQAKILRALQSKKIRPVGFEKEIDVDARIIAATNKSLFSMVQSKQFREDLYYRLRCVQISTARLRDHPEDIPIIAARTWAKEAGGASSLPKSVLDELQRHTWPGNVRELKSIIRTLHTLFGNEPIGIQHLRAVLQYEGLEIVKGGKETEADGTHQHIEQLRHLRRVAEVARACQVILPSVIGEAASNPEAVSSARVTLGDRLNELEMLCLDPLQFSDATFTLVYQLRAKLSLLQALLEKDRNQSVRYWKNDVVKALNQVAAEASNEINGLVKRL